VASFCLGIEKAFDILETEYESTKEIKALYEDTNENNK